MITWKSFFLRLMSIFTGRIVKRSHVLARTLHIFLKKLPTQNFKGSFVSNLALSEKIGKVVIKGDKF